MPTIKNKIKTLAEVVRIAERARRNGLGVVTENGCFDVLHAGHVQNLEWAKSKGDMLILGINSDSSVKLHKGPLRPIVKAEDRAKTLAALEVVDYVFVFSTKSPIPWLLRVKPSVHVKGRGSEKSPAFKPEEAAVKKNGGRVILAPNFGGRSTTRIVERILERYCKK